MQCKTAEQLEELFVTTSFVGADRLRRSWGNIKSDDAAPFKLSEVPYVSECTYFGETMICLASTYEGSSEDCLFIKELVRLYAEGKLVFKE